jgi:hypothetical protein
MEMLHTLERCDPKIHEVSNLECDLSPLGVSITFLTGLDCFEMITNDVNFLFCSMQRVHNKDLTVS